MSSIFIGKKICAISLVCGRKIEYKKHSFTDSEVKSITAVYDADDLWFQVDYTSSSMNSYTS